ncbi:Clp1/GlmU family protein [Thermococcus thioreducens]|uniref:polynucleotide 5'-hydroxyl-kinase n=1 Tax=Thermococcus thioreducens TaxID=277988 RepID=A0A0Q2UPD7_9EURY|nr:Clp1/GlmU family protein [Thermococcus thioreducens]ASJ11708.1 polyhydroxyalkanoate depolymerase [Thermococcus thioreducens]KQH82560.1 polyhydroxyalkanoate depolymerase [Thermococcus thioreducens]SEW15222.1 polynucleotide 5'-hydroxyl-kinase GRC3/NOL9 [Thermococcus thioreducens]
MNKATYTEDVPPDRFELLERIMNLERPAKVMLIGPTDSGKTTLLTFLANRLLKEGLRVAVVDSDVGQKGILPPATVSLAFPEGPFESIGELRAYAHYFIGTITPGSYTGEMAVGVKRLADMAIEKADVVLIDTTGFVTGQGIEMKRLKAELVGPELIVFLERNGELTHLQRLLSPYGEALTLSISEKVREHSRGERREVRKEKWRTYFSNTSLVEVNLSGILPTGTELFKGRPLTQEERELLSALFRWLVIAGWKGERYVVVKAEEEGGIRGHTRSVINAVDFDRLSNLLVGFIDRNGLCLGVGILKWINFGEMKAQVLTPLPAQEVGNAVELRFGRIRVLETGEELGLLRREEL